MYSLLLSLFPIPAELFLFPNYSSSYIHVLCVYMCVCMHVYMSFM